jgi:hypothetical protein
VVGRQETTEEKEMKSLRGLPVFTGDSDAKPGVLYQVLSAESMSKAFTVCLFTNGPGGSYGWRKSIDFGTEGQVLAIYTLPLDTKDEDIPMITEQLTDILRLLGMWEDKEQP